MSNEIQQARDVLAKWRDEATSGEWVNHEYPRSTDAEVTIDGRPLAYAWTHDENSIMTKGDARLIVGTAGSPELLDAVDDMLKHTAIMSTNSTYAFSTFGRLAERIAAAIIAADERMRS